MSDLRLLILAGTALVLLAAVTVFITPAPDAPPLSVRSDEADGALALQLWLERSGYRAREITDRLTGLERVNVLFVLNPTVPYSESDARLVQDWVRMGNTLIVAGTPFVVNTVLEPYDAAVALLAERRPMLSAAAPTLLQPPVDAARTEAVYAGRTGRGDAVPHLFSGGQPVLVSFPEGAGQVWVSSAVRPFTNLGLQDAGSARLIANLLAGLPPDTVIGFDEQAHGFGGEGQPSIAAWLVTTASGWGVIALVVLTFAYLALRGRRFGSPVPIPEARLRRESVEYLQAMAGLLRRSGGRAEVLRHYEAQFGRRLSEGYGVDPRLDGAELVKTIVYREPSVDEAALRGLLGQLARREVSETELVAIAAEMDRTLRSMK